MLRSLSLGRFTTRYFLVILIIFIYIIIDSFFFFCYIHYTSYFRGLKFPSDELMRMFVNYLLFGTLTFVVFSSPPLLSLFLLRRPSFWRVLLHVATAFYILWMVYIHLYWVVYLDSLRRYVELIFLLVYSGAALVAGLPEATAAGRWARLVYYAALLFWLFLAVELLL